MLENRLRWNAYRARAASWHLRNGLRRQRRRLSLRVAVYWAMCRETRKSDRSVGRMRTASLTIPRCAHWERPWAGHMVAPCAFRARYLSHRILLRHPGGSIRAPFRSDGAPFRAPGRATRTIKVQIGRLVSESRTRRTKICTREIWHGGNALPPRP